MLFRLADQLRKHIVNAFLSSAVFQMKLFVYFFFTEGIVGIDKLDHSGWPLLKPIIGRLWLLKYVRFDTGIQISGRYLQIFPVCIDIRCSMRNFTNFFIIRAPFKSLEAVISH